LANKGAVGFAPGINGLANTAAQFTGSTSQALYIADSGAADPFRITTGSWGCWFRTAKRGVSQDLVGKASSASRGWRLTLYSTNALILELSSDGAAEPFGAAGISDVADDRWHFGVATLDGTTSRVYVDGILEGTVPFAGAVNPSSGPLNIGATFADSGTPASQPHYGRVDEAFVTADVLSEDQVRLLYAAKIAHGLGVVPTDLRVNVHRRRKGATLAVGDFTAQPLRLYNFTAGAMTDAGSNNTPVGFASTALTNVAGTDGAANNALSFGAAAGAHLVATDAALPAALTARSYGCWLKTASQTAGHIVAWGTLSTGDARLITSSGAVFCLSAADQIGGTFVADGQWHFAVVVEDNAAADGVKRKLYADGRLVAGSTVMTSLSLAGLNKFRIGAAQDGSVYFIGQIDGVFVCGYAMAQDEIARLYAKGGQDLGVSPKNAGDHIERADASSLLVVFDTLESQHTVDVGVAA
jgi:hypothetical protein